MSDTSVGNPLPAPIQWALKGVTRHILTTAAGGLGVACGLSQTQDQQFITGGCAVVLWLAGVLWSMAEKKAIAAGAGK